METLLLDGSVNVTDRFDFVLNFGFILYMLMTFFAVFLIRRGITDRNEKETKSINFLFLVLLTVHYILCIIFRYDHFGRVCSGDDQDPIEFQMYSLDGKALFLWWQVNLPWMLLAGAAAGGCLLFIMLVATNRLRYFFNDE